jgi:hypothetical protein
MLIGRINGRAIIHLSGYEYSSQPRPFQDGWKGTGDFLIKWRRRPGTRWHLSSPQGPAGFGIDIEAYYPDVVPIWSSIEETELRSYSINKGRILISIKFNTNG